MTRPNPIAYEWFLQALRLEDGEEDLKKVIREYTQVDKVKASRIEVVGTFRDGKAWVRIYVKTTSPLVGFKKGSSGEMERIVLQDNSERDRQVFMMLSDGCSKEKIIKTMKLSPLEQSQLLDKE